MIIRFTSPTCVPCRAMAPVLARLLDEGYNIKTSDITLEDLYKEYNVSSVPTFVNTDSGATYVGAMTYQQLKEFCDA